MESVEAEADGVDVGGAGGLGGRAGDRATADGHDIGCRAGLEASVDQSHVAVGADRGATRAGRFDVLRGAPCRRLDAVDGLLVGDDRAGVTVELAEQVVEGFEDEVALGFVHGAGPVVGGVVLGGRSGERLRQAVEAVRGDGRVAVDDRVTEQCLGRLDLLCQVQCNRTGCGGADPGEDAVHLEAAAELLEVDVVALRGHFLRDVLRVDGTERGRRESRQSGVAVGEDSTTTDRVDHVVEGDEVHDLVGAELVDHVQVEVGDGVLGRLCEGYRHGVLLG